jgi:hypothetical protein
VSARAKIPCEDCKAGTPLHIAGFEYGFQDEYRCESCGQQFHPRDAIHGPDNDGCVWHHDTIRCLDNQRNETPATRTARRMEARRQGKR